MRRVPEGTDLLFLAPGWKGLLPDSKRQQCFEMRGLGIRLASLPSADRFAGDAQQFGQARLRQPDGSAQAQYGLAKGIVSLTVEGLLHEQAPFCVTPAAHHGTGGDVTWDMMGTDLPRPSQYTYGCWMRSTRVHAV